MTTLRRALVAWILCHLFCMVSQAQENSGSAFKRAAFEFGGDGLRPDSSSIDGRRDSSGRSSDAQSDVNHNKTTRAPYGRAYLDFGGDILSPRADHEYLTRAGGGGVGSPAAASIVAGTVVLTRATAARPAR